MAVLEFDAAEVKRIVAHALTAKEHRSSYGEKDNPGPRLWLVGDHGVYLMSNGKGGDKVSAEDEPTKLFVSYAKGINPDKDDFDDWWYKKGATFGADDGVESLPIAEAVGQQILAGAKVIRISITTRQIKLLDFK